MEENRFILKFLPRFELDLNEILDYITLLSHFVGGSLYSMIVCGFKSTLKNRLISIIDIATVIWHKVA